MDLKALRRQRRSRFMSGLIPYMGYIIQSGVAMVFILVLIIFSAWYTSLLRDVPPGLPIRWIMLLLLAPSVVHSSFRTYLQSPDTIFLLPQGHRMKEYFTPAWVSGNVWKLLRMLIVLVTIWPLYIRAEQTPKQLLATFLLLVLIKLLASYGYWREIAMQSRSASAGYQLLRWAVCLLMVAAWLWQPPVRALIFIVVLGAAYAAALAVPKRLSVPWERLIAVEKEQGARALMMLGWFVDIPGRGQRVYARRYLARWGSRLPWRKENAYRFLLTKSFARGDIFGIVLRIAVLALLLVWWNRSGYLGSGIYVFFVFIIGVQLSALRKLHEESFWLSVYPLPEGSKSKSSISLIYRSQLVLALVTGLPFFFALSSRPLESILTLAAGGLLCLLFRGHWRRKEAAADADL